MGRMSGPGASPGNVWTNKMGRPRTRPGGVGFRRPGARRKPRRPDGTWLELGLGVLVVRQVIQPVLQVVRAAIAEIEIVAVFPHVAAEQHLALAGGERVGAVRGLRHL